MMFNPDPVICHHEDPLYDRDFFDQNFFYWFNYKDERMFVKTCNGWRILWDKNPYPLPKALE